MKRPPAALMALSMMVASEPSSLQKLAEIRATTQRHKKPAKKDRTKIKAARKQKSK